MKATNYYNKFVNDRDLALEKILNNTRLQIADITRATLLFVAQSYLQDVRFSSVSHVVMEASQRIEDIIKAMRRKVWLLTITSESEVLKRIGATDKSVLHISSTPDKILNDELEAGGTIYQRTLHYFTKIVRKLENLKEMRALKNERLTPEDVRSVMPRPKFIPKNRHILRRLTEADPTIKKQPLVTDFVTEDQWQDILDDYTNTYIPQYRGPDVVFQDRDLIKKGIEPSERYDDVTYGWEIEQDVTHDFVQTVRLGQSEAANAMGVTDLVWIAVRDSHTDSCCLWRDGLKTSEIEVKLNSGDFDEDENCDQVPDGIAVPLHWNCRCRLAPSTDDLPPVPASNQIDFDEWLEA